MIVESVTEVNGRLEWLAPKDHQRRSVPYGASLDADLAQRTAGKVPRDLLFTTDAGTPARTRRTYGATGSIWRPGSLASTG